MSNKIKQSFAILRFTDMAAVLILPPGHLIMIIEINIFLCEQLISAFIMGCPGGKSVRLPYWRNGVCPGNVCGITKHREKRLCSILLSNCYMGAGLA